MTTRIIRAPIPSAQNIGGTQEGSKAERPSTTMTSGNLVSQGASQATAATVLEQGGFETHTGRDVLLNEGTSGSAPESSRSGVYRELQQKSSLARGGTSQATKGGGEQASVRSEGRARGQMALALLSGGKELLSAESSKEGKALEGKKVGASPNEQKIFDKKKSEHLAGSKKLAKQTILQAKKETKTNPQQNSSARTSEKPSDTTATSSKSGLASQGGPSTRGSVAQASGMNTQPGTQASMQGTGGKPLQPGGATGALGQTASAFSTPGNAASAATVQSSATGHPQQGQQGIGQGTGSEVGGKSAHTTASLAQQTTTTQAGGDILGKSASGLGQDTLGATTKAMMGAKTEGSMASGNAAATAQGASTSAEGTSRSFSLQSLLLHEAKEGSEIKGAENNKETQSSRQEFRELVKQWANAKEMAFLFNFQATVMPNDVSALAWKIATLAQQGALPKGELMTLLSKMLKTPGNRKKMDRIKNLLIKKGMVAAGASAESLELIAAMIAMYLAKKGDIEADDLLEELFGLPSRNLDLIVPDEGGSFHEEGREEQNHQEHQEGLKLDKFKS